jgi:predicted TIM-barrel fold metal-dependent hydrolase
MPICCHIGSSSKLPTTSPDAPFIVSVVLTPMNAAWTCVDWLFSGLFIRFPQLKLCLSEGGIGWIPYVLERCEYTLDRQGAWSAKKELSLDFGEDGMKVVMKDSDRAANYSVPPRELFRDHIYGCFIDDEHGARSIDLIGVNNVMIETDYPHTDSTWPNSMENARRRLVGRSDEDIDKILRGNAKRVFQFEPAEPPSRV